MDGGASGGTFRGSMVQTTLRLGIALLFAGCKNGVVGRTESTVRDPCRRVTGNEVS